MKNKNRYQWYDEPGQTEFLLCECSSFWLSALVFRLAW